MKRIFPLTVLTLQELQTSTIDSWTTQVWIVWVHLHEDAFRLTLENVLEICNNLKNFIGEPCSLEILKK